MFTWIPIHRETIHRILEHRQNQKELLTILREMEQQGLKVISLQDEGADGQTIPLAEIDPFSFLATFNRGVTDKSRRDNWAFLKARWGLKAAVPDDFRGIPTLHNMVSRLFPYAKEREKDHVQRLWQIAALGAEGGIETIDEASFDQCLQLKCVGVGSLSICLFWINPEKFLPADHKTTAYGKSKGITTEPEDYQSYRQWLSEMTEKVGSNFPQVSDEAHLFATQQPKSSSQSKGWKFTNWMVPVVNALRALGGSGRPKAVHQKIQELLALPDSVLTEKMGSGQPRFYNEVALARKYLVWEGLLESPKRGTWALTAKGKATTLDDRQAQQIAERWAGRHQQEAEDETDVPITTEIETYDKKRAMKGLFLAESQFDEMLAALEEKMNVVLQGAPGVGKTYVAKRLAYALIGSNDPQRIEMIQFHQSYSYEDFIQGFRPTSKGQFDLKYGIFHQFCRRAQREAAAGKPYVFIIDEINRGNLSKIFGELMMLVEPDKRGKEYAIPLAYSQDADEKFYIPENLHLIGMMNTADRSLAMVDYALRRRFRFINLRPEFSSEAFGAYLTDAGAEPALVSMIVARMNGLNEAIAADTKNLGPGYQIGHSYFCPRNGIKPDAGWYRRVVESEIMPLIQEYWFDNEQKVKEQRLALLA